jgi:sialidase-1
MGIAGIGDVATGRKAGFLSPCLRGCADFVWQGGSLLHCPDMPLIRAVLCLAVAGAAADATASGRDAELVPGYPNSPRFVFSTDLSGDVDDAAAFGFLFEAVRRGRGELAACVTDTPAPSAAPAARALLDWAGFKDVPLGAYQGDQGDPRDGPYAREVADAFGQQGRDRADYEDDVAVLRRVYAAAPDRSIVFIAAGFLNCLDGLMGSGPDSISPLTGRDLFEKKTALVVAVGANFAGNPEGETRWNWKHAPESAARVINQMTRPFYWLPANEMDHAGFPAGDPRAGAPHVVTGPEGLGWDASRNPVQLAFELTRKHHPGLLAEGLRRKAFDPAAVRFATDTDGELFDFYHRDVEVTMSGGRLRVDPERSGHFHILRLRMPSAGGVARDYLDAILARCDPGSEGREKLARVTVFESGKDGYAFFRIPSVIAAADGALLAFAEGRVNSGADHGDIDLVMRRSEDMGETWGPLSVIWDDGPNTCGNPTVVLDRDTGRLWLALTHNLGQDDLMAITKGTSEGTRTVWITHSDDHGVTWAPPREITPDVKLPEWRWFATGPGVGIQLQNGRLVIPANRNTGFGAQAAASLVFYSDDHGATWRLGGEVGPAMSECQVAELKDGRVMLNARRTANRAQSRVVALSADGGASFGPARHDDTLIEPTCQASLLTHPGAADGARVLLFCNPATDIAGRFGRKNLTVRLSRDDGQSWPRSLLLQKDFAAYSCLVSLPDGGIGCLFEAGGDVRRERYQRIDFVRFDLLDFR